jgi:hypothetical protein
MKSTPGSDRASPLHGQVKFVPSIVNVFSLVPDPNAETLLVVPLPGDVAETPGAARMKSNMLNRRTGINLRSSGPNRVSNPLPRASRREPAPSTTSDSSTPATLSTAVRSIVALIPIQISSSRYGEKPFASISSLYSPDGSAGKRSCPVSFVVTVTAPPIRAGELKRTAAPDTTSP